MKRERPILFSGEMVRAIIEGRKTQTRRVLSYQPDADSEIYGPELYEPEVVGRDGELEPGKEEFGIYGSDWSLKCPYGKPGDLLWVRETFAYSAAAYVYKADYKEPIPETDVIDFATGETVGLRWRPSIHMPREASRLALEVVRVRVERVQEISFADCWSEGITSETVLRLSRGQKPSDIINAFATLWNSINAERGFGWKVNPWVWVIEFKKVPL